MCRKLVLLTIIVLFMAGNASAAVLWFNDLAYRNDPAEGTPHIWNDPNNWNGKIVPGVLDTPGNNSTHVMNPLDLNFPGGRYLLVDATHTGASKVATTLLRVGHNTACTAARFVMTGGLMEIPGAVGAGTAGSTDNIMDISGGTINCGTFAIDLAAASTGSIATIDGTADVNCGTFTLVQGKGSVCDIRGGELIIGGDATAQITLLDDGATLTAYGGRGVINQDYNVTRTGQTTVTATPLLDIAWAPNPTPGETNVEVSRQLQWSPGDHATHHDIYFGTSVADLAVKKITVAVGTESYDPHGVGVDMPLNTQHYWRIDEVNNVTATTWSGTQWDFTTISNTVVDDFEAYDALSGGTIDLIDTWDDGWDGPGGVGNGSTAVIDLETSNTHGGGGSLSLGYINGSAPKYALSGRAPAVADMTKNGSAGISVWFAGLETNAADIIGVELYDGANTGRRMESDDTLIQSKLWQELNYGLDSFTSPANVDETSVDKVSIKIGDGSTTGSGTVYVDDVAIYVPRCFEAIDGDVNGDCAVTLEDARLIGVAWLSTEPPSLDENLTNKSFTRGISSYGVVDMMDWSMMAEDYPSCNWIPESQCP